jgi:hypothetical protein
MKLITTVVYRRSLVAKPGMRFKPLTRENIEAYRLVIGSTVQLSMKNTLLRWEETINMASLLTEEEWDTILGHLLEEVK